MPPSTRVSVSKGGCEKAVVVSEGAPSDMANRIVLGEHRAVEECLVVGMKRHGSERGRYGARLTTHHCVRRATVVNVHPGELLRPVIGAFCVGVRGCSEANADPPRPECLDVVSPIGLGAELRRWKWYCQCGAVGPSALAPEYRRGANNRSAHGGAAPPLCVRGANTNDTQKKIQTTVFPSARAAARKLP